MKVGISGAVVGRTRAPLESSTLQRAAASFTARRISPVLQRLLFYDKGRRGAGSMTINRQTCELRGWRRQRLRHAMSSRRAN